MVRIVEELHIVTRAQLVVDERYNQRERYQDSELTELAASLNDKGQLVPMYGTRLPDDRRLGVRDGFCRMACVDRGLAPDFAKIDQYKIIVLTDHLGNPLPEREIRRYCATVNRKRRNWSELEEARFYQAEIEDALTERLWEINREREQKKQPKLDSLPPSEEKRVRGLTVSALAVEEGVTEMTVYGRLQLLQLPPTVRACVRRRVLRINAAMQFKGMNDDEVRRALNSAVRDEENKIFDFDALLRGQGNYLVPLDAAAASAQPGATHAAVPAAPSAPSTPRQGPPARSVPMSPTMQKAVRNAPETTPALVAPPTRNGGTRVPSSPAVSITPPQSPPITPPTQSPPTPPPTQAVTEPNLRIRTSAVDRAIRKTVPEAAKRKKHRKLAVDRPRSRRELAEAIAHYEERKRAKRRPEQAAYALKVLRWVLRELESLP